MKSIIGWRKQEESKLTDNILDQLNKYEARDRRVCDILFPTVRLAM